MKRSLLILLAAAVSWAQTSPGIEGDWQGTLGAGPNSLRLLIHISKGFDGIYLGQLDSLDQGSSIPMDSIQVAGDKVHFELKAVNGTYDGTLGADGHIKGTWSQGVLLPLELTRASASSAASEPAPPPDLLANIVKGMGLPVDINVPVAPVPFPGHGGGINMVYELHLTNVSPIELHISRIEVTDGNAKLAAYEGKDLNEILEQFGADTPDRRAVKPGMRVAAFVWVRINPRAAVPQTLHNRMMVDGFPVESTVTVSSAKPPVLGPPLRGSDWLAANGPSNTSGHRRALIAIDGKLRDAQRFAIDWVKVDDKGRTFSGDEKDNKTHYAYGNEVLAVADATVSETKDGIPENIPGPASRAVPITLETIAGNHIVLDLGGGLFALYAHLQPGSLKVKVGDKVRRGQVLGLVGNTGNSTEPHLHFHVSDANSPLGSEGVPYVLDSFEVVAGASPGPKTNALPLQGARIRFDSK
jgi:murein DD-endopeptidase MepM/ murein hydrolase activator NlpD